MPLDARRHPTAGQAAGRGERQNLPVVHQQAQERGSGWSGEILSLPLLCVHTMGAPRYQLSWGSLLDLTLYGINEYNN